MLKKTLPAAIALAAGLGLAGAANAVNVNHDGTGQVLIYDWYTVEDGIDTLISITNTTDEAVALKVRFVESMNSQEVLDFNLYLSREDVWVGAISATADGAQLTVPEDQSCTVPEINGVVPFRNYQYLGSDYTDAQGGPQGLDRTRTGYLEVIQMGVLQNESGNPASPEDGEFNPAYYATHVAGTPNSCDSLVAAWQPNGAWVSEDNGGAGRAVGEPEGGQYGTATHINVDNGTAVAVNALALDNFFSAYGDENEDTSTVDLHNEPGDTSPSLADVNTPATLPGGKSWSPRSDNDIDLVSIVLMMEKLMNDYVTMPDFGGSTDWIVTFPTKRFYVNGWSASEADSNVPAGGTASPEPFTSFWTNVAEGSSCESIGIQYWDREEGVKSADPLDFSPRPPGDASFALCYEANVLSLNGSDIAGGAYTRVNLDLEPGFDAGWLRLDFLTGAVAGITNPLNGVGYYREIEVEEVDSEWVPLDNDATINGLPAIGHSVTRFVNGAAGGAGVLANYQYESKHKAQVTSGL